MWWLIAIICIGGYLMIDHIQNPHPIRTQMPLLLLLLGIIALGLMFNVQPFGQH